MLYLITVVVSYIILKLFFSLEVQGAENIPSKGAFILASNHLSFFDPPILGAVCYRYKKRTLNFFAKEELFYNKIFSWYIRRLKAFPIKRRFGDIGAIKESIRRIKEGGAIAIFPEGGRSVEGNIKEGFRGIALLATKAKIPVVPVFMKGADFILGSKSKPINFCKVHVRFGTPILFYGKGLKNYSEITNRIMLAIKGLADNS